MLFRRRRRGPTQVTLADRARDAREWAVAAVHYRAALTYNPFNPPIWVQYGHVLRALGQPARAEAAYRKALEDAPEVADTHLQLGHVLQEQEQAEAAAESYLRALALDPKLDAAAHALNGHDRSEDLLASHRQALQREAARRRRRPTRIERADRAMLVEGWETAARLYAEVLEGHPDNASVWVQYGHALKGTGNLPAAEQAYRRALALNPADAETHFMLGHVLQRQGEQDEAQAAFFRSVWSSIEVRRPKSMSQSSLKLGRHPELCQRERVRPEDLPGNVTEKAAKYMIWNHLIIRDECPLVLDSEIVIHERSVKRLGILALHEENRTPSPNVKSLAEGLSEVCDALIIINSYESEDYLDQFSGIANVVICRRDHGRDFGSWLCAYFMFEPQILKFDELVFLNDSVFGPLYPLSEMFEKMKDTNYDAWSATDHWGKYHLQSYFMVFKKPVIISGFLSEFFGAYDPVDEKSIGVIEGEQKLSRSLLKAGFKLGACYPYTDVARRFAACYEGNHTTLASLPENFSFMKTADDSEEYHTGYAGVSRRVLFNNLESVRFRRPLNPYNAFWDILISEFRYPFLKREILTHNPGYTPSYNWIDVIRSYTNFDAEIILETLKYSETLLSPL